MNDDRRSATHPDVDAALRELARDETRVEAPRRLELNVMRAFDASVRAPAVRTPRSRHRWLMLSPVAAAAAAVVLVFVIERGGDGTPPARLPAQSPARLPAQSPAPVQAARAESAAPEKAGALQGGVRAEDPARAQSSTRAVAAAAGNPRAQRAAPLKNNERDETTARLASNRAPREMTSLEEPPRPVTGPDSRRTRPRAWENGFMLVSDAAFEPQAATVVRMRVPRRTLADLGMAIPDPDAAGHVVIEVLMGEDGIARSVRLPRHRPIGKKEE